MNEIFSTFIWQNKYPQFQEHKEIFLKILLDYEKKILSKNDFELTTEECKFPPTVQSIPELKSLFMYICYMAFEACRHLDFVDCDIAITNSWINTQDHIQYDQIKNASKNTFIGIFYLTFSEETEPLEIKNTSIDTSWNGMELKKQNNKLTADIVKITPEEGNIVIFPSYLPHSINPSSSSKESLSLVFEILAVKKNAMNSLTNIN